MKCNYLYNAGYVIRKLYVIVVTHARVPHGIYWLSSDLAMIIYDNVSRDVT